MAYSISKEGADLFSVLGLLGALIILAIGIYFQWRDRYEEKPKEVKGAWQTPVKIKENSIVFPEGYFCKYSSIHETQEVPVAIINEVHLRTVPVSIVINNNEVIFLPQQSAEKLTEFAKRHQIKISHRFDIWEGINEPFLDTEFEEEHQIETLECLRLSGLPLIEVKQIRRKIWFTMALNMFAWEWVYLGQFDYLSWAMILTRKKYWWSMEVALRNYEQEAVYKP